MALHNYPETHSARGSWLLSITLKILGFTELARFLPRRLQEETGSHEGDAAGTLRNCWEEGGENGTLAGVWEMNVRPSIHQRSGGRQGFCQQLVSELILDG